MFKPIRATSATEEQGSEAYSPTTDGDSKSAPRGFLHIARRDLNDEELSTTAARRFLIAEIERLDKLCDEHGPIIKAYHAQSVKIAVLEGKYKKSSIIEVLSGLCLAVGSAGIGAGQGFYLVPATHEMGIVVLVLSVIMVLSAVVSQIVAWK